MKTTETDNLLKFKETLPFNKRLERAVQDWRKILPESAVVPGSSQQADKNTMGIKRKIPFILYPCNKQQVSAIVKVAQKYRIPIYTVSTGKNWGYGTECPVGEGNVLVNLSRLDNIVHFDSKFHTVRLQPGVTQGKLYDYLKKNNLNYMVPTTGAGPNCSIIGNLLERGYGITPICDHFESLISIEAIMPNGNTYISPLKSMVNEDLDNCFRWGVGPYLDGIFSQSNFGIVVEATIAIVPRPERIESFILRIREPQNLPEIIETISMLKHDLGTLLGGINLMNDRRVLSMMMDYPKDKVSKGENMSEKLIAEYRKAYRVPTWTVIGTLYGPKSIVKASKKIIVRSFRKKVHNIQFMTLTKAQRLNSIAEKLPKSIFKNLHVFTGRLLKSQEIVAGIPNEIALPLAYWKNPKGLPSNRQALDPARDQCGLRWFSPLVPIDGSKATQYINRIHTICGKYGIEPLITLTTVSFRCFDGTVPLLFDLNDPEQVKNVDACQKELLEVGQKEGFFPYRFSVEMMKKYCTDDIPFWEVVGQIKASLDPYNILSPGRYSPDTAPISKTEKNNY